MKLQGFFRDLCVRKIIGQDADGNDILGPVIRRYPDFQNNITDVGLEMLGTSMNTDNIGYCHVGTGSAPPSNSDTSLATFVAATNAVGVGGSNGVAAANAYLWRKRSYRFAAGSAHGKNLTEIGVGPAATGNLFSRTLIKDGAGSPTTIQLAADEVLDVIYELRGYIPTADVPATLEVDGVPTSVTMRHHFLTSGTGLEVSGTAGRLGFSVHPTMSGDWSFLAAGAFENQPAAGSSPRSSVEGTAVLSPYVPNSRTRKVTITFGLTLANYATGLGCVSCCASGSYAESFWGAWTWGFAPKLNKTDKRVAEVTLAMSWDRRL